MHTPQHPAHTPAPSLPLWLRLLLGAAVLAILLAVFGLYTQPDFMLTLANQVWACF